MLLKDDMNRLKKIYHLLRTLHLFSVSMLSKKGQIHCFQGVSDWTAFEKKKKRRKALAVHGSSVRTVRGRGHLKLDFYGNFNLSKTCI